MMFFSRLKRFAILFGHLLYTMLQMLYGGWRITKLPQPIISIFGSSRLKQNTPYALKAHELGQRFMENGVSILTGGGPGIMEAAVCGIKVSGKNKGKSMAIGVRGLDEGWNRCAQNYFELEYFFARKWLLNQFSTGFVIFPGGFGTLDELAEVLTLIQTKSLKQVPVVLIGKEYWQPLVNWIMDEALEHGAVLAEELELFYVTDDLDEAYCWVLGKCDLLRK